MNSTSEKLRALENPPQFTKNIPDEIILQICSSLPAKSIGRFRCASKSWNSLLSEPRFIKTHLNRIKHFPNEEHQSLILVSDYSVSLFLTQFRNVRQMLDELPTAVATKLTFDDHPFEVIKVICCMVSCDGLILVQDSNNKFLLVNPTTREIREVPPSPYSRYHPHHTNAYGLGYDSVSDDYKVVTISFIFSEHDCTHMHVNVYSVRNGTWKRPQNFPCGHAVDFESGAFVHGHIHWVASRRSDCSSVILAFDLVEEKYHEVPPPPNLSIDFVPVALGGCLCLYRMGLGGIGFESDILVMKEYGVKESWTKFTIFYDKLALFIPICLLGKEQVVLVKQSRDEKLVMYNLEDGTFKDIVTQGIPDESIAIGNCLESLVSPYYTN